MCHFTKALFHVIRQKYTAHINQNSSAKGHKALLSDYLACSLRRAGSVIFFLVGRVLPRHLSLSLAHTQAHTPFAKFAVSPPPIVSCSGSFCSHYLQPLMCVNETGTEQGMGWLPHSQLRFFQTMLRVPRVVHRQEHYLNSLPRQDYAMATKLCSAGWRWGKRKL